jgi:23S rRNA pseudouridine2605 synthase
MKSGVRLEDGPAQAIEVVEHERAEKNVWIRVVVAEGRYHLVKRLCEAVGLQVQRLFRPEFGGITVEGLRPGFYRMLRAEEVRGLKQRVGLEGGAAAPLLRGGDLPKAARRHGHGPPLAPGMRPPDETDEADAQHERGDHREARPGRRDRPGLSSQRPGAGTGAGAFTGRVGQGGEARRQRPEGRNQGGSARTSAPPARRAAKKGSSKKW